MCGLDVVGLCRALSPSHDGQIHLEPMQHSRSYTARLSALKGTRRVLKGTRRVLKGTRGLSRGTHMGYSESRCSTACSACVTRYSRALEGYSRRTHTIVMLLSSGPLGVHTGSRGVRWGTHGLPQKFVRACGCAHIGLSSRGPSLSVRLRSDAPADALADARADTAADARADTAADARADACAFALADARADDRRAGRCAVGCASTLEYPVVSPGYPRVPRLPHLVCPSDTAMGSPSSTPLCAPRSSSTPVSTQ